MTAQPPQYLTKLGATSQADRQLLADIFNQGTIGDLDLLVSSTGAALSVSVASGSGYVYGSAVANQGAYRVFNDSAVTVALPAAAGFPRVDQIVARVYDSDFSGVLDKWQPELVQGAESSGATLSNRSGAASTLPANSLLLADVLVPVGAGQVIPAANINDRRTLASPKSGGSAPIGTIAAYAGTIDPGKGWVLADGRLIDKTRYAFFFAQDSHAHNGGVDPGSNKVRIPDRRGRSGVGANSFGTAQGASARTTVNNTRGATGGEEFHTLTAGETPPGLTVAGWDEDFPPGATSQLYPRFGRHGPPNWATSDIAGGGGGSHYNMQPFESNYYIVRIA